MDQSDHMAKSLKDLPVLIVEDEAIAARRLVRLLSELTGRAPETIGVVHSLQEAQKYLQQNAVSLLLLDLNLRGESGFELLDFIASAAPLTIIVSAQTQMAIKAFEYGVVDFVPKPYSEDRLAQALARLTKTETADTAAQKYIGVKTGKGRLVIPLSEISHMSAGGGYVTLHRAGGQEYLHDRPLRSWLKTLPANFMRIHRGHIINDNYLARISSEPGSRYFAEMKSGAVLPIGRAHYAKLKSRFLA